MAKSVTANVSERERYALWYHFNSKLWVCNDAAEHEQLADLWRLFNLAPLDGIVTAKPTINENEFSDVDVQPYELTRDEVATLVKFCGRPMVPALSRVLLPVRLRFQEAALRSMRE